jgi:hypothetical protein
MQPRLNIRTSILLAAILFAASFASANHTAGVFDNHRPGSKGGNPRAMLIVPSYGELGSPLVRTKACMSSSAVGIDGHLAGKAFGHADPILKDSTAVCGHGVAIKLAHFHDAGRPPLLTGHEVTGPTVPGHTAADAPLSIALARSGTLDALLELLRKIDWSADRSDAAAHDIRVAVQAHDAHAARKSLPRPSAARQESH